VSPAGTPLLGSLSANSPLRASAVPCYAGAPDHFGCSWPLMMVTTYSVSLPKPAILSLASDNRPNLIFPRSHSYSSNISYSVSQRCSSRIDRCITPFQFPPALTRQRPLHSLPLHPTRSPPPSSAYSRSPALRGTPGSQPSVVGLELRIAPISRDR